ncbi:MAG: hypothetical protein PHX57_15300, partial [Desulfobulbaceae bacterium]|nr:hypothetical protein [Desulfobulbaceae bacterium]
MRRRVDLTTTGECFVVPINKNNYDERKNLTINRDRLVPLHNQKRRLPMTDNRKTMTTSGGNPV